MPQVPSVADRRSAVVAARKALTGIAGVLWQEQSAELGPLFKQIDDLSRMVEAARVAVLAEAVERGETSTAALASTASLKSAGVGWVHEWAPSLVVNGGASRLFQVVTETRSRDAAASGPADADAEGQACATAEETSDGSGAKVLREALLEGRVGVSNAAVCLSEMARLRHRLMPEAVPTVWAAYVRLASEAGVREIRALRPLLVAQYGGPREWERDQERAKMLVVLSQPFDTGDGLFDYRLRLDAEGKCVLEAALGVLSAPRPVDGLRDLRGSDRRRGDALIELVRRAVASGRGVDGVPTTTKAQLFVTVDWERLRDEVKAGTVAAGPGTGTGAGDLLPASTIRRLACDGGILPTVLGSQGRPLDLGYTRRCFTAGQVKTLWLRDGGCSMPGCTIPATWTDAHHLQHWADGGLTDLGNAALLCGHHHAVVHQRRLAGRVNPSTGQVVWDLARGSYDTELTTRRRQGAVAHTDADADADPPERP